jgi:hypothetical protein
MSFAPSGLVPRGAMRTMKAVLLRRRLEIYMGVFGGVEEDRPGQARS